MGIARRKKHHMGAKVCLSGSVCTGETVSFEYRLLRQCKNEKRKFLAVRLRRDFPIRVFKRWCVDGGI